MKGKKKRRPAPKDSPAVVARKQALRERRARAVDLAARGATWPMIAQELGYEGANRAHEDVLRAYREIVAPNVELMREEAYEKLQRMYAQVAIPIGARRTRLDPATGKEVPIPRTADDEELDLRRMALARQLLKDVRDLFGLDAPKKVQVAGALLNLSAEDVARMSTSDLEYVAANGRLPASLAGKPPLRLVQGAGGSADTGEGGARGE